MNHRLFLLFNHRITADQIADAHSSLTVSVIVEPPEDIKSIWKRVPPELPAIDEYLVPVKSWLSEQSGRGDYLLVQGDFGATYIMVCFAFKVGLIPIYSTTERLVVEETQSDGAVNLKHTFRHYKYRRYGR
jgi:hypothetical protein